MKAGWKESSVSIQVPLCVKNQQVLPDSITFNVPGFHFRSIVDLYTRIITISSQCYDFVWTPFKEYYNNHGVEERVYSELYSSDAFIDEYHKLQNSPREPNCQHERLIVGLMFWSDATLMANFGTAKLWPIYMAFGNSSKYLRGRPASNSMYDVAYLPSVSKSVISNQSNSGSHDAQLPDNFQDFMKNSIGETASPSLITFCRRELIHSCWSTLLDENFCTAYSHGTLILFPDGVTRM